MDEHKITADTTPMDSDPIPQEMPSKVPDHGEVTRFRESYFIEEFEEDEQLNEGHATAVFSTSEEDSLEEDIENEATDPPPRGDCFSFVGARPGALFCEAIPLRSSKKNGCRCTCGQDLGICPLGSAGRGGNESLSWIVPLGIRFHCCEYGV